MICIVILLTIVYMQTAALLFELSCGGGPAGSRLLGRWHQTSLCRPFGPNDRI